MLILAQSFALCFVARPSQMRCASRLNISMSTCAGENVLKCCCISRCNNAHIFSMTEMSKPFVIQSSTYLMFFESSSLNDASPCTDALSCWKHHVVLSPLWAALPAATSSGKIAWQYSWADTPVYGDPIASPCLPRFVRLYGDVCPVVPDANISLEWPRLHIPAYACSCCPCRRTTSSGGAVPYLCKIFRRLYVFPRRACRVMYVLSVKRTFAQGTPRYCFRCCCANLRLLRLSAVDKYVHFLGKLDSTRCASISERSKVRADTVYFDAIVFRSARSLPMASLAAAFKSTRVNLCGRPCPGRLRTKAGVGVLQNICTVVLFNTVYLDTSRSLQSGWDSRQALTRAHLTINLTSAGVGMRILCRATCYNVCAQATGSLSCICVGKYCRIHVLYL